MAPADMASSLTKVTVFPLKLCRISIISSVESNCPPGVSMSRITMWAPLADGLLHTPPQDVEAGSANLGSDRNYRHLQGRILGEG